MGEHISSNDIPHLSVYQNIVAHELKEMSSQEDSQVVLAALDALVKGTSLESVPASLKDRVDIINHYLKNPDDFVHEPDQQKAFQQTIIKQVKKEIEAGLPHIDAYRDMVADVLRKIPAQEDKQGVIAALEVILQDNFTLEAVPASLKEHVSEIRYFINNPDEFVENPEQYATFQQVIKKRVKQEIKSLKQETPEAKTQRMTEQKAIAESQAAEKKRYDELVAELAKKRGNAYQQSTESLFEFIKNQKNTDQIGDDWKMDALIGHESVVTHFLVEKKILSREDFLQLTVHDFTALGDPIHESKYQQVFANESLPISLNRLKEEMKEEMQYATIKQSIISSLKDRDIVSLSNVSAFISELPDAYKKDKDIGLIALQRNGLALEFLAPELQNNREIVLVAIEQDGSAWRFASEELKQDKDLLKIAIQKDRSVIEFIPEQIQKELKVLDLIETEEDVSASPYVQEGYISKEGFLQLTLYDLLVLQKEVMAKQETMEINKQNILDQIKKEENISDLIQFIAYKLPEELKNDKEIALAALKHNNVIFQILPEELRKDRDFISAAVEQDGLILQFIGEFQNDEQIVFAAVQQNGLALEFASPALKGEHYIVLAAAMQNRVALDFVVDESIKEMIESMLSRE